MARRFGKTRASEPAPGALQPELVSDDGGNVYAQARQQGHVVDRRAQVLFVAAIVLVIVYLVGLVVPKNLFYTALHQSGTNNGYTFAWFVSDFTENINGLVGVLAGNEAGAGFASTMILFVIVAMTGAAMALSGAVYQGTFRNALVTPSTLGVMTGASLGMALWVVFIYDEDKAGGSWFADANSSGSFDLGSYLMSSFGYALCCFAGCLFVVGVVLLVIRLTNHGSLSGILMIITGQVIGGIMGAITNTLRYYYVTVDPDGQKATLLQELQISSFFRSFTLTDVAVVGLALLVTFTVVMHYRSQLTLLSFSEAEARLWGLDYRKLRTIALVCGGIMILAAQIHTGMVGLVSLIVPYLSRSWFGCEFSRQFVGNVCISTVLLLVCRDITDLIPFVGDGLAIGSIVSIVALPLFLIVVSKQQRGWE